MCVCFGRAGMAVQMINVSPVCPHYELCVCTILIALSTEKRPRQGSKEEGHRMSGTNFHSADAAHLQEVILKMSFLWVF